MSYDANRDPYVDPATGILRNLLGIGANDQLALAEADLTSEAIASLVTSGLPGSFDLARLQAIHRRLFGDIYSWAGELRTVEIAKGSTRFANADFIVQAADELFGRLAQEKLLTGLDNDTYAKRLAHYYSEVNILHPFREGNGRAQRVFFTFLAEQSGRRIAWERMDARENVAAAVEAYDGDEVRLVKMLVALLQPLQ